VYLGLGSNLGNREEWIERAVTRLKNDPAFIYLQRASMYSSAPMGPDAGDTFLNTVVSGLWLDTPAALLESCQRLEARCGRTRAFHWAPRTLDIDVLFWEGVQTGDAQLRIPHPGLCERAFALVPLLELSPDLTGADGRPLSASLDAVLLDQGIEMSTAGICCV